MVYNRPYIVHAIHIVIIYAILYVNRLNPGAQICQIY